jgi:hypothetical protein
MAMRRDSSLKRGDASSRGGSRWLNQVGKRLALREVLPHTGLVTAG